MLAARLQLDHAMARRVRGPEFARLVRDALGRETLTASTVQRWEEGSEPDLATIAAIASVCGVDPGWLAFGAASKAPPPENPVEIRMRRRRQDRGGERGAEER